MILTLDLIALPQELLAKQSGSLRKVKTNKKTHKTKAVSWIQLRLEIL